VVVAVCLGTLLVMSSNQTSIKDTVGHCQASTSILPLSELELKDQDTSLLALIDSIGLQGKRSEIDVRASVVSWAME